MQIGIDISRIAQAARTGTEHYTYEVLAALAAFERSHTYTLYCNALPAVLPPLAPNFRLRRIPLARLWTHARLSLELLTRPPDVLFVPAHVLPLAAPLCRGMRSVVTIHDLGYLHFPAAHTRAQRLYLRLSTIWSARAASRVIAISAATRDDLVRLAGVTPQKISVVYHGLAPRFRPVTDRAVIDSTCARYGIVQPYFFYVGTVQPRKNLVRLIEAFARLCSDNPASPAHQLVLAGKRGWLSEPIERRAVDLGVADRVHFTGYVADHDLPALLSGATLFAFPSLYEGFGMPVLEAMACGAPVLASRTSALGEVAGAAALLVDPASTEAIAAGMLRLRDDAALRADLRARGFARAAAFSWERCARATLDVLIAAIAS